MSTGTAAGKATCETHGHIYRSDRMCIMCGQHVPGKQPDLTDALARLQAAFREALRRYPTDVEGALIFFASATGMTSTEPNDQDIEWAKKEMERHGR